MRGRADLATVSEAVATLSNTGERIDVVRATVPDVPGLYAFHANDSCWRELGLEPIDGRPLYVGKAERSLQSRDVRTHFQTGKTGSSTVRRSFAALLRESLSMRAMPRNPANPGHYASFGLEPDADARLTTWMCTQLTLAWWTLNPGQELRPIEIAAIRHFQPPLNLTDVSSPSPLVKAARALMAAEAKAWTGASA